MATQTITLVAHGIAVVFLIVTALVLFTRDRLPPDSLSLALIMVLILGLHLFPYELGGVVVEPSQFLLDFGNEAPVATTDKFESPNSQIPRRKSEQQLYEIAITGESSLHYRKLADVAFGSFFDLIPPAVHRARVPGEGEAVDPGSVRLRAGDVALVQGIRDALKFCVSTGLHRPH